MQLQMQVPPTVTLADVRGVVAAWGRAVHADPVDLLLIVTELLANARDATQRRETIGIQLDCKPGELTVQVRDQGPGFELGVIELPPPQAPRGRGLPIVAALADVSVDLRDGRTVVTARTTPEGTAC